MSTPIFCCGWECGIAVAGAAPGTGGVRHWVTVTGVPTIATTNVHTPGTRALECTTAAGAEVSLASGTVAGSKTVLVSRFFVYFATSLPSADCQLWRVTAAAGTFPGIFFKSSDSKIYAGGSSSASLGATGVSVTTNTYYRIDCKVDVSSGTRTCDVQVDGTACGQWSTAVAASTIGTFKIGINCSASTSANATVHFDDLLVSATGADYPLGAGVVAGLSPNADGTHNFSTAGDFQYGAPGSLSNVATSATDVWTMLDDRLDNVSDVVAVPAASNTEYVEVAFADLPSVTSINGVEVVAACHAAGTTADKQTLRINDGGTLSDVYTDLDESQTSIVYNTKHYAVAPSSSAAWTKGKVDALLARWNSSYGTVDENAVPYVDALMLEVDYVEAAGGSTATDTDTGTATEVSSQSVQAIPADSGALTDNRSITAQAVNPDAATVAELAIANITQVAADSDSATLTDSLTALSVQGIPTDAGTLTESVAETLAATAVDAGTMAEARLGNVAQVAADAGTASDTPSLGAALLNTDAGALTEAQSASQAGTGGGPALDTESAALVEQAIAELLASVSDSASATDGSVPAGLAIPSDSLALGDVHSGTLELITADVGTLTDAESIGGLPPVDSDTDAFIFGDDAVVSYRFPPKERGTRLHKHGGGTWLHAR